MRAVLAHKEAETVVLRSERDALRKAEARRERILAQTREVMSAQEVISLTPTLIQILTPPGTLTLPRPKPDVHR